MRDPTAMAHRRRVAFIPTAADAARTVADRVVVLDTAWTPRPNGSTGATGLRPLFAVAGEGHDLLSEALAIVDGWADAAGLADRLVAEGVTYWFRLREELWHWVHERLLWRYALAALEGDEPFDAATAPADERALLDVLGALGRPVEVSGEPAPAVVVAVAQAGGTTGTAAAGGRSWRRFIPSPVRRGLRRLGPRAESPVTLERRRWDAFLDGRLASLDALPAPRIVVLTRPGRFQQIGADDRRQDPNLGAVIPALVAAGCEPVEIGQGMRRDVDADRIAVERDERLMPAYVVQTRWGRPDDRARAAAAVDATTRGLDGLDAIPLLLDGLDMSEAFLAVMRAKLDRTVRNDILERARVERLIRDLAPDAVLMTQEGHRTGWLAAAAGAGVPSFALQHGVLYPAHPGYADTRHPELNLPTCTFVFGDYERRVLEGLAYHPDEVAVSGSPRLDLDGAATGRDRVAERAAVRRELGVADGDRMLVVSTMNVPFIRRSHLVHMLDVLLGGPLPGIHVVVKQHPGEGDEGPARALLTGLAVAGGYEPPPISVVKDIDLYRLLRAADAHLGQHSTVLTDAVLAGTDNLIAVIEGSADILGYVPAGVARAVHSIDEVRDALRHPEPVASDARRAFIEDHFRSGDASARIAAAIATIVHDRPAPRTVETG